MGRAESKATNEMQQLLLRLSESSVTLEVNGNGQLVVNAPAGAVNAELGAMIREHKAELVELLRKSEAGRADRSLPRIAPDPASRHEPFPLNAVQHAYWIGRNAQMELGGVSTHFYFEAEAGALDLERFEAALDKVIRSHDMLRATISNEGLQRVQAETPPYRIRVLDLRGQPAPAVEDAVAGVRAEMSQQVFDSTRWPLFEVRAARLDDARTHLFFSWDFLVVDAWSILMIFAQWRTFYDDASLPPRTTALSFRDYILAERALAATPIYTEAKRYWWDRLDSLPAAPVLPVRGRIEPGRKHEFVRRRMRLEADAWTRLSATAQAHAITPSNLMLAAFAEVLDRWSKSRHYALNLTLFNRLPMHDEVMALVGDFTTLTITEIGRTRASTFLERAKAIQNSFLQDFEHRHFSGVEVLREMAKRRQLAGRVLMPVVFTSAMMLSRKDGGGDAANGLEAFGRMRYGITQTPQVLFDCQIFEIDGELVINWDTVEELFLPGVLDAMFGGLQGLVSTLAGDPDAWRRDDLVALPPAQQAVRDADHRSLDDSQLTDGHLLLHDGFVRHALARPDAIAIDGDATISYGELLGIACDLADRLVTGGVRPNQLVGVVMEKGWQQIAAVLGILIAGGAYLPVDPALPAKRQNHLLRHGEAMWVLASAAVPDEVLEGTGAQVIEVVRPADPRVPESAPPARQRQSDIAYVIFTSGSSGTPKGVVIDHRGALTTILAMNALYGVGPSDRVLAVSSLSFDLSVYDIFGLLAAGGTVIVPPKTATKDPAHWSKMIERHGVTLWNSAPQLMTMLVDYNDFQRRHAFDSIRSVWLSGDWIPTKLPARIRALVGPCEVISLGGATEGSIWSIHHRIEGDTGLLDSIPYGKALPGQSMHVFDADLRPCPDHVIGHIHIGGPGVALGYWKDPERTAQRFFAHPKTGELLYWTGDLGRYASDGTIEFLGREDEQVKLHGHRVELGEIAAQLKAHPHVADAAVYIAETDDAPALIACVVAKEAEDSPLFAISAVDADAHAAQVARLTALADLPTDGATGDDLARFGAFWRDLSALSMEVMAGTLRALGVPGCEDIDAALARAGVRERFRSLVDEWIASLEDAGSLDRDADGRVRLAAGGVPEAAIAAFEAEYARDPRTSEFCRYVVDCMRRQPELLSGQVTPLELLYPEGDFSIARHIYGSNPVSAHHNRQLAAAFAGIVADRPAGERLRVIELGAGTGAATALLLPLLDGTDVDYWFTDVSPLFLERAKQEFARYPFVRYDLYNIDLDAQTQGFALHDFDVIVAANALHDAKHIPEATERLRRLLKPGGHLLLIEGTGNTPWQWVTVGYLEGVDEYADDRAGTRYPVLDTERWRRALGNAGFDGVDVFPHGPGDSDSDGARALREAMPQRVIIARGPPRVGRFDPEPLREYLQAILPAYMVPQRFVPMDELPLTANGKIDRAALPRFQRSTQNRARVHAPARPGTEQTLHSIWKEVLGLGSIGANDNFFDLGGDSLLLTHTLGKINRTLGLDLAMADLFSYPTIRSLSEHIDRAGRSENVAPAAVAGVAHASRASNDIAIIGMSGRFPDAPDIETYWRNLRDGLCSVRDWSDDVLRDAGIPDALLADPGYVKTGVPVADLDLFDATYFGFAPREALMMDPQLRFLLEESVSAMEHAGYPHQKYGGEIGVYVGKDVSQYLNAHLVGRPDLMRSMGVLALANLNEKDYAATQISYNLGFTGPSLNINTACSTSLVAVHQACRSLLDGECAIALAGGASLETVQPTGYQHQDGSIVSMDGRCRAFSDDSDGCMRGSGLGLVVLKPLERALADRDTVHAIIKGTAINNDGALKIGFTAPSMQGQARVIAAALDRAGLAPSQVQYIEAHGTGTALGDAVEIKGLNQVYSRAAGARCLVGSVKTNFGHLDAAAGIAGLIKVVLSLHHAQVPASLHFRAPNPRIDFGDGALRVNDRLIDWPATDGPRRAGVSSFGVGGTNAHAVLEQGPAAPRAPSAAGPRLFAVSATNPRSLKTIVDRLADWIDDHPDADPDDVAYTLQVGRNAHAHRIAVVGDDLTALREALRRHPQPRACDLELTPTAVFVFAADADVRPQTLAVLKHTQPVFREHFDRCAELVRLYLEADLGEFLVASAAGRPADPALAAALRFSQQYALARLWLSFGLRPEAMIGQDIGEYVAACLSGVFSLEEALSLVVVRAQLIDSTDPAAPRAERVASILDTFADCVRETRRGAVGLPFVSGIDAAWVDDADVADPEHWLRHLRGPDRFTEGLAMLAQSRQRSFLAVGAETIPAAFAAVEGMEAERIVAMADRDDGRRGLCVAMAGLWANGVEIDWQATWGDRAPGRIPLPTYAFDRQSYWLSPLGGDRAYARVDESGGHRDADRETATDAVPAAKVAEELSRFPRPDLKTPFAGPVDDVQRGLAALWSKFLSLETVGVDDNFFELGGDSLLGVQINEWMKSELGIDLQIDKLFLLGTVRNIANYHAIVSGAKTVGDMSDEEVDGIIRAYEDA